jgi:hypothetical protein
MHFLSFPKNKWEIRWNIHIDKITFKHNSWSQEVNSFLIGSQFLIEGRLQQRPF